MFELKQRPIVYYKKGSGKVPFEEWLSDLKDKRARAVIEARFNRIQEGNFGTFRPVGENIYEIKIDLGPGYRIYFTLVESKQKTELVILLLAGDKSTQDSDIKKAKEYYEDLISRYQKAEKPEDEPIAKT